MTTTSFPEPNSATEPSPVHLERAAFTSDLLTHRVVIAETRRFLTTGFHIKPGFTDNPELTGTIAEFGSHSSAQRAVELLAYATALTIETKRWPRGIDDAEASRVCRVVADTGACLNLLEWSPSARIARQLIGTTQGGSAS